MKRPPGVAPLLDGLCKDSRPGQGSLERPLPALHSPAARGGLCPLFCFGVGGTPGSVQGFLLTLLRDHSRWAWGPYGLPGPGSDTCKASSPARVLPPASGLSATWPALSRHALPLVKPTLSWVHGTVTRERRHCPRLKVVSVRHVNL